MRIIGIENKIPDKLYRIALGVRFQTLNYGKETKRVRKRERLVAGYCWLASQLIGQALDELGWSGEQCCGNFNTDNRTFGWGHCWVEWRGCVLDVTADQFNYQCKTIQMKPIVFCHKSKLENIYLEAINNEHSYPTLHKR